MHKLYNYLNKNLIIIITIISYLYLSYNLYYKNYNIIFIYFFFLLIGYYILGIKIYYYNFIIIISDLIYKLIYKKILIKENMSDNEWNKKKQEKEKNINQQEKPKIDLSKEDANDTEKKLSEKTNEEKETPNNYLYK